MTVCLNYDIEMLPNLKALSKYTACFNGTDTGSITGTDTDCTTGTGCFNGTDTGSIPGTDTGSITGTDSGCFTGTDTGSITGTDTDGVTGIATDTGCVTGTTNLIGILSFHIQVLLFLVVGAGLQQVQHNDVTKNGGLVTSSQLN